MNKMDQIRLLADRIPLSWLQSAKRGRRMRMGFRLGLASVLALLLFVHCADYFTAPGPQPGYVDEKIVHDPKFSVFGMLRPDSTESGLPQSFIKVDASFPIGPYPESNLVEDATITVLPLEDGQALDSLFFEYTDMGSFPDTLFRRAGFFPKGGESYRLICRKAGYPTLVAETTVPDPPKIILDSFRSSDNTVHFEVQRDEKSGLVEAVLLGENYYQSERFVRPESGNTSITLTVKRENGSPSVLFLYAYDLNLAEYLSANLSIKPNIYQSDFSTVENGYGCFGSLNYLKISLSPM